MARKIEIDYERLETDWRAGIKSPAMIADEYTKATGKKVTGHAIVKHFKKHGIERDLTAKIRAKTDSLVTKKLVTELVTAKTNVSDTEIIEANATQQSTIILNERKDVSRVRIITMRLLSELEAQITDRDLYEKLGEILGNPDDEGNFTKINDAYHRILSFGGRTDSMKKLSETLKTLIELERKVYKIDEAVGEGTIEDFIRKSRGIT